MISANKTIACRDCGQEFLVTMGEQEFFVTKGLQHEPVRCPACRALYKRECGLGSDRPVRDYHDTVCAECGSAARVPFVPRDDRPVYCSSCFDRVRAASG